MRILNLLLSKNKAESESTKVMSLPVRKAICKIFGEQQLLLILLPLSYISFTNHNIALHSFTLLLLKSIAHKSLTLSSSPYLKQAYMKMKREILH